MGASATKMMFVNVPYDQVFQASGQALFMAGAKVNSADYNTGVYTASFGVGMRSWGENMTVFIGRTEIGCSLNIRSECINPIQLMDWGKNNQNIQTLTRELSRILQVPVY